MKTIYNWILILAFAFIIFILHRIDIALFALVLLWVGSYHSIEKLRKSVHVFQMINDGRSNIVMNKLGISEEEGAELLNNFENETLTEKQRKDLHKDMNYLGM